MKLGISFGIEGVVFIYLKNRVEKKYVVQFTRLEYIINKYINK